MSAHVSQAVTLDALCALAKHGLPGFASAWFGWPHVMSGSGSGTCDDYDACTDWGSGCSECDDGDGGEISGEILTVFLNGSSSCCSSLQLEAVDLDGVVTCTGRYVDARTMVARCRSRLSSPFSTATLNKVQLYGSIANCKSARDDVIRLVDGMASVAVWFGNALHECPSNRSSCDTTTLVIDEKNAN